MKTPEELAEAIISAANRGYHNREDYPAYAVLPWDDRLLWSDYIQRVATDVLREALSEVEYPDATG